MKRLAILLGLTTLALATPAQAADCPNWDKDCIAKQGGTSTTKQRTPKEQEWWDKNCGYGGANTKDPRCAQIEGGGSKQGTGTDWQPPPTKPPPGQDQASGQRCPPGTILLRYGSRYRCVRRGGTPGQDQAGSGCQPGWIWSSRLYRCVPGTVGQGPYDQGGPGRRVCGYGKVWSDRLNRCVPFRTGGGTDGGDRGGYGCGPGERWSERAYRCVPRRGGSGGIYIDLGGIGGNIGISNKRRCGHGTYWDGDRCVARRGGDDYSGGGVGYGPNEKRRGSGGNDYGGRGR